MHIEIPINFVQSAATTEILYFVKNCFQMSLL